MEEQLEDRIRETFSRLDDCIAAGNPNTAWQSIYDLQEIRDEHYRVPDAVVDGLIARLSTLLDSPLADTVLHFFELAGSDLTGRQKRRSLEFLESHVDQFTDGDARHSAWDLCDGVTLRHRG